MPKGLGKGYDQLTEEDKDRIVNLFLDGIKIKTIKNMIPCTQRAVPAVLKEKDIITRRKNRYDLNEYYFNNINREDKAYFLGLLFSDGCVTGKNYVALALSGEDSFMVEKFAEAVEYTGKVYVPQYCDGRMPGKRINFSSQIMVEALASLNMFPHKSQTRAEFPNIQRRFIRHFIRGLFDGDGSIYSGVSYSHNRKYAYRTWHFNIAGTYQLTVSLQNELRESIGYEGRIHKHLTRNCCYYCIYQKQALKDIYHYMYDDATIFLPRKYEKWQEFMSAYTE